MDISIVIPNYNGGELLRKNLPQVLDAVKEYKKGNIEIIIPDDASKDNSVEVINAFIKSIKQKNIVGKAIVNHDRSQGGFSKNVNRGVGIATGEIVILLNSDVVPHKGFVEPLLEHFSDEKVFAVGCMDESIENGKTVLRGRGVGRWQKGFLMHSAGDLNKSKTLWVSGGSGAFRKSMWDKLGGLDELFNPFYWEDIDVSYRAQKAGWKTIFEKKSIVMHEHGKGAIITSVKSYSIQKIAYRNQFLFVWLDITDRDLLFSHIFYLPYHLLNAIKGKDKAFLAGFFLAVGQLPQVWKVRQKNKKLFIEKDSTVLASYKD